MKVEYLDCPVRDKTVGKVRVTFGSFSTVREAYIVRKRIEDHNGPVGMNVLSLAWPILPPIAFQSPATEITILNQWKAFRHLYRFARGQR